MLTTEKFLGYFLMDLLIFKNTSFQFENLIIYILLNSIDIINNCKLLFKYQKIKL